MNRASDLPTPHRGVALLALAAVVLVPAGLFVAWIDNVWMAADLGYYAHVADRILAGELPARDFEEIHAGYVHVVNVAALAVLGPDLLNLRWPLVGVVVIQSVAGFALTLRHGVGWALLAGLTLGVFSPLIAPNPTANWYVLVPAWLLVWSLASHPHGPYSTRRLLTWGFLVGLAFMIRQLSGALLGIGLVSWLLGPGSAEPDPRGSGGAETPPAAGGDRRRVARSVFAVMVAGLGAYLAGRPAGSAILFGLAPFLLLLIGLVRPSCPDGRALRVAGWLAVGGVLAVLPAVVVHAGAGSLGLWLHDSFLAPFRLAGAEFIDRRDLLALLLYVVAFAPFVGDHGLQWAFSLVWAGRLALAAALGAVAVRARLRKGAPGLADPVLHVGLFYAVGAVHYAIALYVFWATPVLLVGLFRWLAAPGRSAWVRRPALAWVLASVALALSVDLPHPVWTADEGDSVAPRNRPTREVTPAPRASMRVDSAEAATYRRILEIIDRRVPEDGAIFSFPSHPEFYPLSGRRNPTRYLFAGTGLSSEVRVDSLLARFRRDPPGLVIYRSRDKYNTDRTLRLRDELGATYQVVDTVGFFELLAPRDSVRDAGGLRGPL